MCSPGCKPLHEAVLCPCYITVKIPDGPQVSFSCHQRSASESFANLCAACKPAGAAPGNLLERQNHRPHPRPTESNLYFNQIPTSTLNVSTTPKCALERKHYFLEGLIGFMNNENTAITTAFTTSFPPSTNTHTHKPTSSKGSVLTHLGQTGLNKVTLLFSTPGSSRTYNVKILMCIINLHEEKFPKYLRLWYPVTQNSY